MRRSDRGVGTPSASLPLAFARILALPAARLGATVAAGVLAVALIAGGVRVLPVLLAPGVPLRFAPVLARGVVGVALETALFVAAPIAWALAASRLVERGEARALFAVGVRPLRIVASTFPAALVIAIAAGLAAASWGREATAPGRLVRDLLAEAREACLGASPPAATPVPLLEVSWVCLPGEPPRVVGAAPLGRAARERGAGAEERPRPAFTARALTVSDDLRSIEATDLELVLPSPEAPSKGAAAAAWSLEAAGLEAAGAVRLHATQASIHGLSPIGRASNLSVVGRALLLGGSAIAMSAVAAALVLAFAIRSRARALALGVAGPSAALMAFSSLERNPSPALSYALVPLVGIAAMAAIGRLAGLSSAVRLSFRPGQH